MADAFGGERPEAGRPIWKVLQQPQEKMGGPWLGMADGFRDSDCQPWRNQHGPGTWEQSTGDGLG